MTSKIRKHSMIGKKRPKIAGVEVKTFEQEYFTDMFTLKMKPISYDYKLKFALEWVNVAIADDDMLTLEEFYILKGIDPRTVERWLKTCPELQQAHDFVMCVIGVRREKGALKNKYDSGMVRTSMAMFSVRWKDLEEWRNAMKEKIAGSSAGSIRVVELDRYPDSPLVPIKKNIE